MEVFRRLSRTDDANCVSPKLIFNPLFEPDLPTILLVLVRLRKQISCDAPMIFSDGAGVPIAYYFPASFLFEDAKYLSLLSTVGAELDRDWLNQAFMLQADVQIFPDVSLNTLIGNSFYGKPYWVVYEWVALSAITALRSKCDQGKSSDFSSMAEVRAKRNAIPFIALMPYHAGDVLFLSMASDCGASHISKVIVSKPYARIVSEVSHGLEAEAIEVPALNREGKQSAHEWEYFESIRDELPQNNFYYYCRPTRDYDSTNCHLVDQFFFALGNEIYGQADLCMANRKTLPVFKPAISHLPFRVLLHFDSGWPLKIYPKEYQQKLIDVLLASGYQVTILDGHYPVTCETTNFQNHDHFLSLLKNHHILVGMDSYPCHYSANILGLPTICLFSSTRPENSNAPASRHYLYLEAGLSCRPCRAIERCPLNGKAICDNFVSPDRVSIEIDNMLHAIYRE